jgi:hypothetical protein
MTAKTRKSATLMVVLRRPSLPTKAVSLTCTDDRRPADKNPVGILDGEDASREQMEEEVWPPAAFASLGCPKMRARS